jgi:hypothetical protein
VLRFLQCTPLAAGAGGTKNKVGNRPETPMTATIRTATLRVDAVFLLVASAGGFVSDIVGAFLGRGPVAPILAGAPHAAIGLVEAHGLAFILGVLLWRAAATRAWHITAAAIHVLLGTANLVFWQFFVAGDMLAVGYITTALHWLFVALQLTAAAYAGLDEPERA